MLASSAAKLRIFGPPRHGSTETPDSTTRPPGACAEADEYSRSATRGIKSIANANRIPKRFEDRRSGKIVPMAPSLACVRFTAQYPAPQDGNETSREFVA